MDRSEWVRVPRVPTDEMMDAWNSTGPTFEDAYAAMIAAAPPPPAEQASGELPELPKYQHSVWVMLRDENRACCGLDAMAAGGEQPEPPR